MEINITKFFADAAPMDYSASIAELGNNAGIDTWNAACDDADDYNFLDTDYKRQEFRQYVKSFGAWDDVEIAAWTDTELNALFLQMIAGDVREVPDMDLHNWNWQEYYRMAQDGIVAGNMFEGTDGQIYYYVGI